MVYSTMNSFVGCGGVLVIFACIVSVSVAQCTGNITNDTMRVRLAWKVLNGNTVSFQLFAPGTKKQFTMLVFAKTNETTTLSNELTGDMVYGAYRDHAIHAVHDKWIGKNLSFENDTQQDLTHFHVIQYHGRLKLSFVRPIRSTDKTQDIDIDTLRYVGWGYGGHSPLVPHSRYHFPEHFGFFDTPMDLQQCDEVRMYTPPSSPAVTATAGSTMILFATIITMVASATVSGI